MIHINATNEFSTVLLKTTTVAKMTPLPPSFEPTKNCVICGRGNKARNHIGNKRFRALLQQSADKYSSASSKVEKSIVVSEIVEQVRSLARPYGGFVKQTSDGKWVEVGDDIAREKVGANLRDLLHAQYKSSTKAKLTRRRVEITDEIEYLVNNNAEVRMLTQQLSDRMAASRQAMENPSPEDDKNMLVLNDDDRVLQLFTQTNCAILQAIKSDDSLLLHE